MIAPQCAGVLLSVRRITPAGASPVTPILCLNPHAQFQRHAAAIEAAIGRVLASNRYILGPECEGFEKGFATHAGTAHGIGVANGTDALALALRGLGVGPGDEVVTVSHTALATVAAVCMTGATPVLADVDEASYTMDPASLQACIGPRTKAIVPVHVYGQMADLDAILPIARQHGLKLLEDCAQSTGARQHGRCCGSIGDAGAFSFYPTKNLGAIGDGGMIVTGDAALAERLTRLRQYGWDAQRISADIGVNSRLDEIQAAILTVKLAHLDDDNARRQAIARRYSDALAGLPLALPAVRPGNEPVWHLYVVATDRRDALLAHLKADGVLAGIHYAQAAHQQPGYRPHVRIAPGGLPVTERIVDRVLSLPLYPELEAEAVEHVIASVRRFYG